MSSETQYKAKLKELIEKYKNLVFQFSIHENWYEIKNIHLVFLTNLEKLNSSNENDKLSITDLMRINEYNSRQTQNNKDSFSKIYTDLVQLKNLCPFTIKNTILKENYENKIDYKWDEKLRPKNPSDFDVFLNQKRQIENVHIKYRHENFDNIHNFKLKWDKEFKDQEDFKFKVILYDNENIIDVDAGKIAIPYEIVDNENYWKENKELYMQEIKEQIKSFYDREKDFLLEF
ncbi:hypothetical protein [Spiroplasma endosymbiont of Labia minor]|uniref:hypothetical protein n=1 Tax=Spiroplasma endosymbiont of Labia minor TaxID=3066305 RepID=UPI0030D20935